MGLYASLLALGVCANAQSEDVASRWTEAFLWECDNRTMGSAGSVIAPIEEFLPSW